MPDVASIGTYLPCWGTTQCRVLGDGGVAAFDGDGDRIVDSVRHQHKPDMTSFPSPTAHAADQTFAMARITLVDVDVTEIHDSYTGTGLIGYEDLGFAERFGGYRLVEAEVTSVGGALPVNPSGGARPSAILQGRRASHEEWRTTRDFRGEAAHQVYGARVALAHNVGGPTAVSAVTILEGSANGAG